MNTRKLATVFLVSASSVLAQGTMVTPPGYTTTEGSAYSYFLGAWSQARMQFAESYLTGRGARQIKQVSYRLDYRRFHSHSGAGKIWKNVELRVAHTSVAAMNYTFTKNHLTTPTTVFSAPVAWTPLASGYPASKPAPFDSRFSFPFRFSWAYNGKQDVLLDYRFSDGTLMNKRAWSSSGSVSTHYLDAPPSASVAAGQIDLYGNNTSTACKDSGMSSSSYCIPQFLTYAKNSGRAATDNKISSLVYSHYTAKNASFVHAVSLGGSTAGAPFPGVTCNKMYVNPAPQLLMLFMGRTRNDSAATGITSFGYITYNPAYAGTTFWVQAAWDDSSTGKLKLSRAGKTTIARQPADPLPRKCAMHYTGTSTTAAIVSVESYANPLIRWTTH